VLALTNSEEKITMTAAQRRLMVTQTSSVNYDTLRSLVTQLTSGIATFDKARQLARIGRAGNGWDVLQLPRRQLENCGRASFITQAPRISN